ncbi:MAG TPA: hypothetical protein VI138_04695 [Candidatus Dormibacteraeota bacterium]
MLRQRSGDLRPLVLGIGLLLLLAGCGRPSGPLPGSSPSHPAVQDACGLLSAAQVAQLFGAVEPVGDTPSASHQSDASTCVWGTGATAAQESSDPSAAAAALEVSYVRGAGATGRAAEAAVRQACGSAPAQVPGVGTVAYYCQGDMAAVKGTKLLELHCFSIAPPPVVASESTAMNAALANLHS